MARIWKAVNEEGIPVFIDDAEALADALEGTDWVLIVPQHLSCDYTYGSFFGRKIRTAIHLFEDFQSDIIAAADWQEPELFQLAEAI